MEFQGLIDKRNIWLLFGTYCNCPKLILDEKYKTTTNDYNERFHKMVFGALVNIAKKSNINKITAVEIENELSLFKTSIDIWNVNNGFEYIENAIQETKDKIHNVDLYRDNVRKYSILRNAHDELKMDILFIYEEYDELDTSDIKLQEKIDKMELFNKMKSKDVLAKITNKILSFKSMWNDGFEDNYSFHLGDNIDELIEKLECQENTWGYPFQSGYMTTIFRGMRGSKFMVRSSISGGGKSRSSMAEACNIGCDRIYDWNKKAWISTGEKQACLFISTELTKEEIQTCQLAHICGIEEDILTEWKDLSEEQMKIIKESTQVMKESLVFGEHMPDFTIDSIADKVEEYILNRNITHCFFDYINDSPSLYSYYMEKTGVRLRTDQILFLFSQSLKMVANKFDIYLGSATQLSSNWKDEKDANALKGSKAIIEKADYGVLSLPATPQDIKKLKPILDSGFYDVPNYCYHIFKNRGGRWNSIIVWTKLNMGTMREKDCFCTNTEYELISDIEKTVLEFQIDDVGSATVFDVDDNISATEYINELNKTKL
jgi:replicative DNA helicase